MISNSQLKEIRDYLNKSENPLFFFDDDVDGLASYLILKKYIDRGRGVMVKAEPILSEKLLHKVKENSPDLIFVLDIPIITQEFIDSVNVPIIWIDHHTPIERKGVHYYNPMLNDREDYKPTSYCAYKIVNQNIWIATIGSISDWYVPEFIDEFNASYPGILPKKIKDPAEAVYESKFGELTNLFSLLLKGKTSEVNKSISILYRIESPLELLNKETPRAKYLYNKIKKLKEEYERVLKYCLLQKSKEKMLLVRYPITKTSFISEISNELIYRNNNKIIILMRETGGRVKMSIRSRKIKLVDKLEKAIDGLDGYGGGHEFACGANILQEQFPIFLERFKSLINSKD